MAACRVTVNPPQRRRRRKPFLQSADATLYDAFVEVVTNLEGHAAAVLRTNDRGRWTVPSAGLYPHQWNWDSAFIALGWAPSDLNRAAIELESLVGMAHPNGMIPHIGFADLPADSYFPSPTWWQAGTSLDGRPTSGISQPPVIGIVLRTLMDAGYELRSMAKILDATTSWHQWWMSERALGDEPVVIHPWESGRDNAIEWDASLLRVPQSQEDLPRTDLTHAPSDERPTQEQYRRYAALVAQGKGCEWNQRWLAHHSYFRVHDGGLSALLVASAYDLAVVARAYGNTAAATLNEEIAGRVERALLNRLTTDPTTTSEDVEGRTLCGVAGAADALTLLVPALPARVRNSRTEMILRGGLSSPYGVRTAMAHHDGYSPRRYWRGPTWTNINWLAHRALVTGGMDGEAQLMRKRFLAGAEALAEYREPTSGEALGATEFSWSAALLLWDQSRHQR